MYTTVHSHTRCSHTISVAVCRILTKSLPCCTSRGHLRAGHEAQRGGELLGGHAVDGDGLGAHARARARLAPERLVAWPSQCTHSSLDVCVFRHASVWLPAAKYPLPEDFFLEHMAAFRHALAQVYNFKPGGALLLMRLSSRLPKSTGTDWPDRVCMLSDPSAASPAIPG